MTTAKLNVQFDYMTLRVRFADKSTFNLTKSRNGTKVSGTHATRPVLNFFDTLLWKDTGKGKTNGERMEALRQIAENSTDMTDFMTKADQRRSKMWIINEANGDNAAGSFKTFEQACNALKRNYTEEERERLQPAIGKVLEDGSVTYEY